MTQTTPADEDAITRVAEANVANSTNLLMHLVAEISESGITVEELAERAGVSVETAESIRRYDYDPRMSELRRFANALGLVIEYRIEKN